MKLKFIDNIFELILKLSPVASTKMHTDMKIVITLETHLSESDETRSISV